MIDARMASFIFVKAAVRSAGTDLIYRSFVIDLSGAGRGADGVREATQHALVRHAPDCARFFNGGPDGSNRATVFPANYFGIGSE
jgi:hypothetical protein